MAEAALDLGAALEEDATIPASYWHEVEATLAAAALSTPKPVAEEQPTEVESWPYLQGLLRKPWVSNFSVLSKDMSQPLGTRIGAAILYGVSVDEQTAGTPRPLPSQAFVNSQLQADCPLVLFDRQLEIAAPLCGENEGTVTDPVSKRRVLRWEKEGHGVHFRVADAQTGTGSDTFANVQPEIALKGYSFSLTNCMGAARYSIDEQIVKVEKMGPHDQTLPAHDGNDDHTEYLLKYSVVSDDGAVLIETNRFRMHSDKVEFSMVKTNRQKDIIVVARATRKGRWTGTGWRSCGRSGRSWHLEFPQNLSDVDHAATLLDVRVVATTVMTLAANREEDRNEETGLANAGENEIFLNYAKTFILMIQVALILCCCCGLCILTGVQEKSRKFLFRFEGAVMPKGAMSKRSPVLHPVY